MADRPTLLRGEELHGGKIRLHRHLRLLPGIAAVVGEDNQAAQTDGNQALSG
ncbi:hypothetical protein D3C81_2146840 [compost metagenome]